VMFEVGIMVRRYIIFGGKASRFVMEKGSLTVRGDLGAVMS